MDRRSVLGTVASGGLVAVAGCLGGFGADETSSPTPVTNREVSSDGGAASGRPQFQGDSANTGLLDATGPAAPVTTYWRRTPYRYDHSQPVVHGSRLFVTFAGRLVCLDRTDGAQRWAVDVGHDGASTPAVHDRTVYVTVWNGGENVDRGLAAVDVDDGRVRWRRLTDADLTTSPTVTADGVFVGGGYETTTVAGFDHDGTERWRRHLGEYASTPAVADGVVYYGAGGPRVVAYDAASGDRQWRTSTDGETTVAPTLVDDLVVVGTGTGTLSALDAADGTVRWNVDLPGPVRRSAAVADDRIVVPTQAGLTAVDREGTVRWSVESLDAATAPVVADGRVYLGHGRTVRALSLADGTERWSVETRERSYTDVFLQGVRAAPTVADGVVFAATQAGDVYALGAADA